MSQWGDTPQEAKRVKRLVIIAIIGFVIFVAGACAWPHIFGPGYCTAQAEAHSDRCWGW